MSERQWRSAANRPRRQPRPSPSAPATKPAKTLGFRRFSFYMCCMVLVFTLVQSPAFRTWFDPFSPALNPSSTQNAPGFALFGPNRVRFSLFRCFLAAKFLSWFLCTLLHSVYKLKPSVIPCRREDLPGVSNQLIAIRHVCVILKKVRQAHNKNSEF